MQQQRIITLALLGIFLVLSLGNASFASTQKASARIIIDGPTSQFSPAVQPNAKPCKDCSPSLQVVERFGPTIQIPFENQGTTSASCGPGEIATGGGYVADVPLIIETSKALPDNTGWTITAQFNGGSTNSLSVTAYAECATITP